MAEEFNALISNHTWDLIPFDANKNVVRSKWIYKTKYLADGSVDNYKARLVAQGFNQQAGFGGFAFFWAFMRLGLLLGLFLSQHKYIFDLLLRFHFHTLKSIRSPLPSRTKLSFTDGELLADATEYKSMVGALQYLTLTRPNITFVVHLVSQFMHALSVLHICWLLSVFSGIYRALPRMDFSSRLLVFVQLLSLIQTPTGLAALTLVVLPQAMLFS
ncbi:unnamed protein product [Cuscuta epithymum]|uniref:Reverse transcriptase Ty1/copia-type domain-containing protein n=1 Tax=Cuscuta epithymum TaxID=186058 RepID=A0AAV0FM94_9ASTE|nr:unnamed protein product [Cuscuta epithymum]